jgi:hypothetical protein
MFTPGNPRDEQFMREFPRHRERLERERGIIAMRNDWRMAADMLGMDAQPALSTTPNSGIPAFLSYFFYPDVYKILFSPLQAEEIIGTARKIGDWTSTTSIFSLTEWAGQVSSYGDYANNTLTSMNATFPERQAYHYQTIVEVGEREEAMLALAKINLMAQKREAAARALNQFQNLSYFFGISGLQNYGFLNDPSLSSALQPGPKAYGSASHGPWITSGVITATPSEIYTDCLSMSIQLQAQVNGLITVDNMSAMTLAMHPTSATAFRQANIYGVTAEKLMKENFPNIKIETAVQYYSAAGYSVQLIVRELEGQESAMLAFTEKMRAHRMIYDLSSQRQKTSQGTWGSVVRFPAGFVQMLGV